MHSEHHSVLLLQQPLEGTYYFTHDETWLGAPVRTLYTQ
jgi:hypothetical protein